LTIRPANSLATGIVALFLATTAVAAPATNAVRVLSIEGEAAQAEVSRAGATAWDPAYADQILQPGDRGRTGPRAKMLLRMCDLSVLRVRERSQFEIKPPPEPAQSAGLALFRGMVYLFHRDKPGTTRIQSKTALAATRGTEFLVETDEPTDRMTLTLIDGEADLSNEQGTLTLKTGEQGVAEPGQPPRRTAVIYTVNLLQWCLYYPGVLDADEVELPAEAREVLRASLAAYREGDLPRALAAYPPQRAAATPDETVYHAALLLSIGQVDEAQALLDAARLTPRASRLASALHVVIAATKRDPAGRQASGPAGENSGLPAFRPAGLQHASDALAESYHAQSISDLNAALQAARRATELSPKFGFAWARAAELEFSFGRTAAARAALDKALALSPRNAQAIALKGFLLSAENKIPAAIRAFDEAIAADSALGNAWLGRGLCRFRQGRVAEGREDLQIAAALEPQRALLRSYLGKGFADTGDWPHAANELALARSLDPLDPTAWLYSALLHQQRNRINESVRDLERAQELNDNRSLYRSQLLLDQDRAVRSANLAGIYADAGMTEVSVREAVRAVQSDYANGSAHLFLANSYAPLTGPGQVNLRYETAAFSEFLVGTMLAPVGASHLSPYVSQQEYSRLFERDGFGLSSATDWYSSGDWRQRAAQHGTFGDFSYSLEMALATQNGFRPNNDFYQLNYSATVKQQITPRDSLFLQASFLDFESGDLRQYYDQDDADRNLRVEESQTPNWFAGYHHEWGPAAHSLVLAGRLQDDFQFTTSGAERLTVLQSGGVPIGVAPAAFSTFDVDQRAEFRAWTAEAQQIQQWGAQTFVVGARYQDGETETFSRLTKTGPSPFGVPYPTNAQQNVTDLRRVSVYAYDHWRVFDALWLVGGLSYDHLTYPENIDLPPISNGQETKDAVSPKAGVIWNLTPSTGLRAAYTRSLGGLYYDNSVRLEPGHVAGFNQAYRSLIPESVAGLAAGTEFETWGVEVDQRFGSGTYVGLGGEWLESWANRTVGVFDLAFPPNASTPPTWSGTPETLDFREKSLGVTLNQLLGREWSLGARYRISVAELTDRLTTLDSGPALADYPPALRRNDATLQQLHLFVQYTHPSGFFGLFQSVWTDQTHDYQIGSPSVVGFSQGTEGDDFWQFNVWAGYRFARRRAEVMVGLLNLTDRDYQLSPVNFYVELPRERTVTMSVKVNF
jgi:tetratricopeptide (TPR) repeat protein